MNIFWFLTGMLTMLAALIVILPWLRTIPRFDSLPTVPWQAPLLAMIVIGAALSMYAWLGHPELAAQPAVVSQQAAARAIGAPAAETGSAPAGSMSAAIDSLRARLAKGSGGSDDWELLAKSYEFIGRPNDAQQARAHQMPPTTDAPAPAPTLSADSLKRLAEAAQARHDKQYATAAKIYKQLVAENQMNADAWADFADTAGTMQGNKLAGEPETFAAKALLLDANHPKALWLKASADEEAGRYDAAIETWQRLQGVLPADSQDAKIVAANLQRDSEARTDAKAGAAGTGTPGSGARTSISGEVSVSSSLSSKATPGATLFIVAKSVDQPGPPVAVYRRNVSEWPMKFTLDDSSSMLPGRNLTNAKHVTVEARISLSGQAQPAAGDLRGVTGVIDPASHQPLKIVISEVVT
jgi:cytochrome c-type biogenesis protein CcmH/NrfG